MTLTRHADFVQMFGKAEGTLKDAVTKKHGELQKIKGAVGEHSYSEEEKVSFGVVAASSTATPISHRNPLCPFAVVFRPAFQLLFRRG